MNRIKLIFIAVIAILSIIIIIQNNQPVDTDILFWSFTMSRTLLLLLMTIIGFVAGVITVFMHTGKKDKVGKHHGN